MPLYFMHLNECGDVTQATEGIDCTGLHAARVAAVKGARELMCAEITKGQLCLACQIDVADEAGFIVMSVPFRDALTITGL